MGGGGVIPIRRFLRILGESYAKRWSGDARIDFGLLGTITREPTIADGAKVLFEQVRTLTDPRKKQSPEMQGQAIALPGVGKVNIAGTQNFAGPKMLQGAPAPGGIRQVREFAKKLPSLLDTLVQKAVPFVGSSIGPFCQTVSDSAIGLHKARRRISEEEIKQLLESNAADTEELHSAACSETAFLSDLVSQIQAKRMQVSDAKKTYKKYLDDLTPLGHGPCYYFSHLYGYAYYYLERRHQLSKLIAKLEQYSELLDKWLESEDKQVRDFISKVDLQVDESVKLHEKLNEDEDCGPNCYLRLGSEEAKSIPGLWPKPLPPPPLPVKPAAEQRATFPRPPNRLPPYPPQPKR